MFNDLAKGNDESTYTLFLNLLNREDGFIANMSARIITKIACGSPSGLDRSDMIFFLTWLKDQLCVQVRVVSCNSHKRARDFVQHLLFLNLIAWIPVG